MNRAASYCLILMLVVALGPNGASSLEKAICLGSSHIYADPGVSMTSQTGTATSIDPATGQTTGVMTSCIGWINGHALDAARSGTFSFTGTYGVGALSDLIGYTCVGGSGAGTSSFSFPVVGGGFVTFDGDFTWNRTSLLLVASGQLAAAGTWRAPMVLEPVVGDCFVEPLMVIRQQGLLVVA